MKITEPCLLQLFRAEQRQSEALDGLINLAENDLAYQTPVTYLRWYSRWRARRISVNDLLNLTWCWRQRACWLN